MRVPHRPSVAIIHRDPLCSAPNAASATIAEDQVKPVPFRDGSHTNKSRCRYAEKTCWSSTRARRIPRRNDFSRKSTFVRAVAPSHNVRALRLIAACCVMYSTVVCAAAFLPLSAPERNASAVCNFGCDRPLCPVVRSSVH